MSWEFPVKIHAVDQLNALWDFILTSAMHYSLNAILAVVMLMVGWWLSAKLSNGFERILIRSNIDATLRPVLRSVLLWLIRVITLIAVLGQFGVQTASVIAILGAAGLAIGLALQGTLQNIAAGMMLLFLRPFQVGDYIAAGSVEGTVDEIGLFTTKLTKADGICLIAPNNQLWNSALINYSRNATRRMDLPIGIDYKDDAAVAIKALLAMINADSRVLQTPEPIVVVTDHGDSAQMLRIRLWANSGDFWAVQWDITQKIWPTLDAVGCNIPFPVRELTLRNGEAAIKLPGQ